MWRTIDKLRLRFRSLVQGRAVDASLKGEILVHLEETTAENIAAGMSPAEARAAALREFGPVAVIEEQCRDTRRVALVEHVGQDLRYTLRSLLRQPMLHGGGRALDCRGRRREHDHLQPRQRAHVRDALGRAPALSSVHIQMGGGSHVSYRQWRQLEESGALGALTGFNVEVSVNWQGPEQSISLSPMVVAANFFDVIGPPMSLGRGFTAAEAQAERDPAVAVVSYGFWQRRLGGDPNVLGRTLMFSGQPFTVLGVLADGSQSMAGFGLAPEVYLPSAGR